MAEHLEDGANVVGVDFVRLLVLEGAERVAQDYVDKQVTRVIEVMRFLFYI